MPRRGRGRGRSTLKPLLIKKINEKKNGESDMHMVFIEFERDYNKVLNDIMWCRLMRRNKSLVVTLDY